MIYLYPANKMENLLALLDKIQQISPLSFFAKETIIVQNAGMQHWLNMSLAKQRGISMNIDYALPAQFLWKLIRSLASEDIVPEQSPYSREVLTWRIYHLLASKAVLENTAFAAVTLYWQGQPIDAQEQQKSKAGGQEYSEQALLKRYQLAQQLADLYEQYLIFRPDWINLWSQGLVDTRLDGIEHQDGHESAIWQGQLWQLLTEELPYNPKELIESALSNLQAKKSMLPARLSFFGINAMAPIWLDFIGQLSEHLEVHFFHLNPCYAYWGDIQSEKQAFKYINQWTEGFADHDVMLGNPLLANLGQQGREFMALLQEHSTIDIDAFEHQSESTENSGSDSSENSLSLLAQIQNDILTLTDGRENPRADFTGDSSVIISSCHSALREVQGLHDWLLHQFNQDKNLTPKDIIVMCPQIEHYAPYIDAVFARGWQELDDNIPPLPCSIADRISKDSDPVIAAFLEILQLPDSRFQVCELVALLRLPAMASKFNLALEEIDKISVWLEQASIHWGLDQQHKEQLLSATQLSNQFTWQQGLSRLLRGFAFGDQHSIYGEQLLLPTVEGSDGELLGKLMLIIERLQQFSQQLATSRSPEKWQSFLFDLLDELFELSGERSFDDISHAIKLLSEYCLHAKFTQNIPLTIVRDFLNSHFSQPDPGRQFMIGQVTFCSMVPMRSIPFKVVAILGLNDGEFPRQRQALGFDLLANAKPRLGDRSRRGDDRYLFLEAIISARKALYLSYQGRNIKNNTQRQPSIVLKEFTDYLRLAYHWQEQVKNAESAQALQQRNLPMQPFSLHNYQRNFPSFDKKWLMLTQQDDENNTREHVGFVVPNELDQDQAEQDVSIDDPLVAKATSSSEAIELNVEELVRFFQHPSKVFAQHQLKLNLVFNETELDDVEPFVINSLESYLLRQSLLNAYLNSHSNEETVDDSINDVLTVARLSGKFPDLPTTQDIFSGWQQDSEQFSQLIIEKNADNPEIIHRQCSLDITDPTTQLPVKIHLQAALPIKAQQLVFYRSSSAKAKDKFSHYIYQLVLQVLQTQLAESYDNENREQTLIAGVSSHSGFYFDTKKQQASELAIANIDEAKAKLSHLLSLYIQGQKQALLLNCELGEKVVNTRGKEFSQTEFENFWQGSNSFMPFGQDAYVHYFWPSCPDFTEYQSLLTDVYQPMNSAVQPVKKAKSAKPASKGAKA